MGAFGRCAPAHPPRLGRALASLEDGVLHIDVAGLEPNADLIGVTLAFRDAADAYIELPGPAPGNVTVHAPFGALRYADAEFTGRATLREIPPGARVVEIAVYDSLGTHSLILDQPVAPAPTARAGEACDLAFGFVRCAPGLVCDRIGDAAPVCAAPPATCAPGVIPVDLQGAADGCVSITGTFEAAAGLVEACDAVADREIAFALPGRRGDVFGVAVASPTGDALEVAVRRDCAADDPALTASCAEHAPTGGPDAWPTIVPVAFEADETAFLFVSDRGRAAAYAVAAYRAHPPVLDRATATVDPARLQIDVEASGSDPDADVRAVRVRLLDAAGAPLGAAGPFDPDLIPLDPGTLSTSDDGAVSIALNLGVGRALLAQVAAVEVALVDATGLRSDALSLPAPQDPPPPPEDHAPTLDSAQAFWNDTDPHDVYVGITCAGVDLDADPLGVGVTFVGADGQPLPGAEGEVFRLEAEVGLDGFALGPDGAFSTRFLFRLGDPEVTGLPPLSGFDVDVYDAAGHRSRTRRALLQAPPALAAGALCEVTATLGACPGGTLCLPEADGRGVCAVAEVECPADGPAPVVLDQHPAGAGFRYVGDTSRAPSATAGSCGGDGANEVFHRFTAPATGRYRFSTEASVGRDTVLYARSHCGSAARVHELGCDDDLSARMLNGRLDLDLTAGDTIFVVVDGSTWDSVDNGPYVLTATPIEPAPVLPTCPAAYGDLVDINAFAQGGAFVVRGTTAGAGSHTDGNCGGADIDDVAHVFTAPEAGRYAFTTQAAGNRDTVLYARRTCDDRGLMSDLGCNDDSGPHLASRLELELGVGEAAYVFVDGAGVVPNEDNVGPYTLTVSRIAESCPPSYGEVVDLAAHPLGEAWLYRGDNTTGELETGGTCGGAFGRERAHRFTADVAGQYVFQVDGVAPREVTAYLRTSCDGRGPADELACATAPLGEGTQRQLFAWLEAGQTVHLFVDSADRMPASSGPYFVAVERRRAGDPDGLGVPRLCPRAWSPSVMSPQGDGTFTADGNVATQVDGIGPGTCGGSGHASVFSLTPAVSGRYEIATFSFELQNLVLYARAFCGAEAPEAELACAGAAMAQGQVVVVDVLAGQTVYLFVDTGAAPDGGFFMNAARLDD